MFKKLQKTLIVALLLIMLMATTCFAEDANLLVTTNSEDLEVTTTDVNPADESVSEEASEEEEPLPSDLYLFEPTADYSRIVDGNAYVIGNDVTFSSVVGGDVFILGNTVTISEDALIYGNLYVMGNSVTINGFVYGGDLYAACSELTINENGAVNRDIRAVASKFTHNGGTGRNIYVSAGEIAIGETAQIYGDLNYSSKEAIQVPSGVVQGTINYSELNVNENNSNPVVDYIMDFVYTLVFVLAMLGILILVAPKFLNKLENVEVNKILPACGIGLAALIITIIVSLILLITYIGAPIGLALLLVWALFVFVLATPVATIAIAGFVANKVEALKKAHNVLAVAITTLVLWALKLIPFVGGIIGFVVCIIGLGLIVRYIWNGRKNIEE